MGGSGSQCNVVDVTDTYATYFATHKIAVLIVRPDLYVYGAAKDAATAEATVRHLVRNAFPA